MLASHIIREVSVDLNDQEPGYEYTRWPVSQLQSYLSEAVITLSHQFRDEFLARHVVRVEPGNRWQEAVVSGGDAEIVRILGETTADGRHILRSLSRVMDDEANTWSGGPSRCHAGGPLTSYSVSTTDSSMFRVYPPVSPADTKPHYVLLESYVEPDGHSEVLEVPNRLVAMVKQWMLYRALSMDSENNSTITQLALSHQQTYFKLLEHEIARQTMEKREDGRLRAVPDSPAK